MMLSRPAGGSAPWAGPQSKANEIVPLATCQPSGFVFRVGRCPGQAPEQRRTSGDPGVMAEHRLSVGVFYCFAGPAGSTGSGIGTGLANVDIRFGFFVCVAGLPICCSTA
jgi:hypothetical protein